MQCSRCRGLKRTIVWIKLLKPFLGHWALRPFPWNCCQRTELHCRELRQATSVEGKGSAREDSAAHPLAHSLPCTSINIHFGRPAFFTDTNSKLYLFSGFFGRAHTSHISDADAKKCLPAAGAGVWKIAERVTANAKYTTSLLHPPTKTSCMTYAKNITLVY